MIRMASSNYKDMVSHVHDLNQIKADLHSYQFAHCMSPKIVKRWDSILGQFVDAPVKCGSCYHCTNSKSTELVTRMFCHNVDWKHKYFVTLTYEPVYLLSNIDNYSYSYLYSDEYRQRLTSCLDISNYAKLQELAVTLPVVDSDNTTNTLALHPCLVSRVHLRNYLKRLRKSLPGVEISVFAVGEAGHSTGRPHYHLLIWSKVPLSFDVFRDAWSKQWTFHNGTIKPFRNQKYAVPVNVSFGNVDVVDLDNPRYTRDGSIQLSNNDVFRYVAKYLGKYVTYTPADSSSVDFSLPDYVIDEQIKQRSDKRSSLSSYNRCRIQKAFDYYPSTVIKARYWYEKKYLKKFDLLHPSLDYDVTPKVPYSDRQFFNTFAPFAVSSVTYAIGKEFLNRNFTLLSKGLCKLPTLDGAVSRFPAYFRKKINERFYSLRFCKPSSCLYSLSIGNIPLLHDNLYSMANSDNDSMVNAACYESIRQSSKTYSKRLEESPAITPNMRSKLAFACSQFVHLYDIRLKLHFFYNESTGVFDFYKRINNSFEYVCSRDCLSVYNQYVPGFTFMFEERNKLDALQASEEAAFATIEYELACRNDGICILPDLIAEANKDIEHNLAVHQRDYYSKHKSINPLL